MPKFTSPLDNIQIAAPCSADWEAMNGDNQVRHCGSCQLNVYNLSAMTKREAEKLLIEREGRLCLRFYRRTDGTIITENCPRGIDAIKRRLSRTATALLSAVITFLTGVGVYSAFSFAERRQETKGRMVVPFDQTKSQINDNSNHPAYETVMGNMSFPIQNKVAIKQPGKKRSDR